MLRHLALTMSSSLSSTTSGSGVVMMTRASRLPAALPRATTAAFLPNHHHHHAISSRTLSSSSSTYMMRPWPTSSIICSGDYRKEEWLEEGDGETKPLYQYQKTLPRLPVPTLEETTGERLLSTVLPLARNEEEKEQFLTKLDNFQKTSGPILHRRLVQRAHEFSTNSSWLQYWWNSLGYLQVRDSNVINVSYFFHFHDDPTIHRNNRSNDNNHNIGINVKRAASMMIGLGEFRRMVCTGMLPPEQIGKKDQRIPLCSTAYKYMFHATRIPQHQEDFVKLYDPSRYHHAIIIRHGLFYSMNFCHPNTGELYPMEILENTLQQIVHMADEQHHKQQQTPDGICKLGYFTGINRDHWAHARQIMLWHDDTEEALEVLQSGAFVICFDDTMPTTNQHIAEMLLHGHAGDDNTDAASSSNIVVMKPQGYNRWYDKSIQIIISNNGKCGLCGEHSMMDGMPVVNLANHLTKENYQQRAMKYSNNNNNKIRVDNKIQTIFPSSLLQNMKMKTPIMDLVDNAKKEYDELVLQNSLDVQIFYGYGSDWIKQQGYSPDAFIQMIMQLATYRLFGEQVGTYESTQVRMYLHGRTETTRSVSYESSQFVKRFGLYPLMDDDNEIARQEKLTLLQKAVLAHVKYMSYASKGYGVDRHFFGMAMLVGDNEPTPELLSDPLYQRAKRWRVSTSHLTHPQFVNWGYGQVVPDGVGLAYSIHPRHCVFNITALMKHHYTASLAQLLQEALMEVRTLIELQQQTNGNKENQPPRSKL